MTLYSVQLKDWIRNFCLLLNIWAKNIGKNRTKDLSSKYRQNLLDHANQWAKDAPKTGSKWAIQKTAEGAGDLIGTKIENTITQKSPQSTSETVERETEILKERYISLKERQKVIDELGLI